MNKLIPQQRLRPIVQRLQAKNKKVVALSGSYDILHAGHIATLQEAKARGDVLVVFLNSDKSIKSYKGPNRPIINQSNRAILLSALACVDFVCLFDEITPISILSKIKPNIFCQGSDWGKDCIERKTVEQYGGKIHVLKWTSGLSTTNLIQNIRQIYAQPSVKAIFLDRDGTINLNRPEYLHRIEDFKLTPYAKPALRRLSKTDYKIIIITMQSGIGRGYYSLKDMQRLHRWMLREFKKEGIRIDKIYYCPHHPKDGCACRKPDIGMLMHAVKDFKISLNDSWLIGDDDRDVLMGRSANLKVIKVGGRVKKDWPVEPNRYANNLLEAVRIILN